MTQKYNKIKELVEICDSASKKIADVQNSKTPSFDAYYKTSKNAEFVCMDGAYSDNGDKFEDPVFQKAYTDLANSASEHMKNKAVYAGKLKDAANAGKITSEEKESLERRADLSLKSGIALVSSMEEAKKLINIK
ncbi:hypothetical protein GCM10009007_03180 [Formosimonas limnophila]|uniref:Uncharacterized protein n=1 Tax=Formosimonas limnophila TaxID=1384487 RepID=A0A8J3G066_9BURK|nr:hypothetical protein GCM10009007_03180 [Formosimonas limnophila]